MTDVRTLADDVWGLLSAVPNLNCWRGEILDATGKPMDPPKDPDDRVHPYAVAYFGAGQKTSNRASGAPNITAWTFQVSCVGGDDDRALWSAAAVRAALTGARVGGAVLVETTDSGPMRRSDNIQPSRTTVDLFYRAHICG